MKKKEHAKEKVMLEIAQENRKLSEPFKKHLQDVEQLKEQFGLHQLVFIFFFFWQKSSSSSPCVCDKKISKTGKKLVVCVVCGVGHKKK